MGESKHTPGPWTVEKSKSHNGYTIWGTPDWDGKRRDVASVFMAYGLKAEERRAIVSANASLIAAAPDLLDALRAAEDFMAGFESDELQDGIDERLATVRAAIAKAEGR